MRRSRLAPALLWSAAALYAGLIFLLSAQTDPLPALTSRVSDKLLHLVEYGGLAALLATALGASSRAWGRALALALVLASLYGASDELHQSFVPGRDCDPLDWVADTLGAACGVLAAARARRALVRLGILPAAPCAAGGGAGGAPP